jgi:hypothetical protein
MKESHAVPLSRFLLVLVVAALALASLVSSASALPTAVGAPPTFGPGAPLPNTPAVYSVAAGDFDGDGHKDVAAGGPSGIDEWLAGGHHAISVSGIPQRVVAADLNRDGRDDVAATTDNGKVDVLLGGPNGLVAAGSPSVTAHPVDISAGDADGDGDVDLVVEDLTSTATFTLLINDGHGAFTGQPIDSGCASGAFSAVIGQFVGDNRADIAVLCQTAQLRLFAPNPAGVFVPSGTQPTCGGIDGDDLETADLDGDGALDIVAACAQGRFSVHLAAHALVASTGPTGDPWFVMYSGGTGAPQRIVATDFNGDGNVDLVSNSHGAGDHTVGVASGDGAGGFDAALSHTVGTRAAFDSQPDDVAVDDLNDDGKPDVLAVTASGVGVADNTTPTPGVSTGDAAPGAYGASVGAAVNPNGSATTYQIQYGATAAYGHSTGSLPAGNVLTGSANQQVGAAVSGLTPLTTYHYRVVASNARGTTYGRDRTFATTVVAPSLSGAPRIAGTPAPAHTVTCETGAWNGAASYAFAWLRDGDAIAGAAGSAYTPARGDAGHALQCRVTASNAGGPASALSAPLVVAGAPAAACVVPSLRGKTVTSAREALAAAGCRLGKVTRTHSKVKRGRIVRSTKKANRVLAAKARVNVVVSRGRR